MNEDPPFETPRKLTREAAKAEQRLYWAGKTVTERLAACTALTRRLYAMRGLELDEHLTDWTVSRVRRPRL